MKHTCGKYKCAVCAYEALVKKQKNTNRYDALILMALTPFVPFVHLFVCIICLVSGVSLEWNSKSAEQMIHEKED